MSQLALAGYEPPIAYGEARVARKRFPAESMRSDGLFFLDARIVERFFSKGVREPQTGCLLWTAGTDGDGYGKFQVASPHGSKQRHFRAHRFALATRLGRWPTLLVLHSCDTPRCVEPSHLREGTQQENIADMDCRGRRGVTPIESRPRGERHSNSKLSDAQRAELLARYRNGETAVALAAEFGVTAGRIYTIGGAPRRTR